MIRHNGQAHAQSKKQTSPQITPPESRQQTRSHKRQVGDDFQFRHVARLIQNHVVRHKAKSHRADHGQPKLHPKAHHQDVKTNHSHEKARQRVVHKLAEEDVYALQKIALTYGVNLISRHAPKHGVRPQRFMPRLFLPGTHFLRHAAVLQNISLLQSLPLKLRIEKQRAKDEKHRKSAEMREHFLKDLFHGW